MKNIYLTASEDTSAIENYSFIARNLKNIKNIDDLSIACIDDNKNKEKVLRHQFSRFGKNPNITTNSISLSKNLSNIFIDKDKDLLLENKYDVIICLDLLSCVDHINREIVIKQIKKSLKPGGLLLISSFSEKSIKPPIGKIKSGLETHSMFYEVRNKNRYMQVYRKGFSRNEFHLFLQSKGFLNSGFSRFGDICIVANLPGENQIPSPFKESVDIRPFLSEQEIRAKKIGLGERYKPWKIGKLSGSSVYFHRQYLSEIPCEVQKEILRMMPENFNFNIIKYNVRNGGIVFYNSLEFDKQDNPSIGEYVSINCLGERYVSSAKNIKHTNKWLYVKPDYKGFSVKQNIEFCIKEKENSRRKGKRMFHSKIPDQWASMLYLK